MESAGVCWMDGSGLKPMVPTMPPFSRLGRSFFVGQKKRTPGTCLMWGFAGKENIWDLLCVRIGEALIDLCHGRVSGINKICILSSSYCRSQATAV